jgi:holliday junction DNA helicase RuvB
LLVDEVDKMAPKDQAFLLNLMETGIITETKYGKNRSAQRKISVFATSNNIKKMSAALRSRFFIVELEPYTYEQFREITEVLLLHHEVYVSGATLIANAVWNNTRDTRDCIKIGAIAKTMSDVEFIVDKFYRTCKKIHH